MTSAQLNLLAKARQSLSAAKLMLDGEYPDYAASRAYYTMFYIAEAFLEGEGLSFSNHSAVISAFGREFARTGRVPVKFHQYLIELKNCEMLEITANLMPLPASKLRELICPS